MARYDDLNTKMIAYWAVLSIVILVLILQGTQALCYNMINATDTDRAGSELDVPTKYKSDQIASLNGYSKVSITDEAASAQETEGEKAKKEVIYIPLDEAQRIILKELSSAKPDGT